MRLYYLLLLLTTSVSGFAQSSMNVKITLSDKVITVPKDNFVSLSFEESNEDDILNNVHIVGYIQSKTEGTKSFYWSGKERKAYILNGEYSEVVATHISGSNGNIYISGWVEDNAGIRKMCLWRNGEMIIPIFNTQMGPDIYGADIFADGDNVHLAYYGGDNTYRINNEHTIIKEEGFNLYLHSGFGVYCHKGDTYTAEYNSILKNGEVVTDTLNGVANAFVVNDQGLHFPLSNGDLRLWSNGVITKIENFWDYSFIDLGFRGFCSHRNVACDDNELYLAYDKNYRPVVWKNGKTEELVKDNNHGCRVSGIFVANHTVYAIGGVTSPLLWVNGKEYNLRDFGLDYQDAELNSIYVTN